MEQEDGNHLVEDFLPAVFQGVADFPEVTAEDFQAEAPEVMGYLMAAEMAEGRPADLLLLAHQKTPAILMENGAARDADTVAASRKHRGRGTGRACMSSRWNATCPFVLGQNPGSTRNGLRT